MTRYLISFDDGAMTFPEEELPDVAKAAHEVVQEAKDAGVWVFGGGLESQRASVVATDGTVTTGRYPETKKVLGGFAVVDVPSHAEALEWAAKIAVACRCARMARPTSRGSESLPSTTGMSLQSQANRRGSPALISCP
ncbi:MAG: YciI family protein [Pseudonocardiaceae bacterium]